jgi:hypothetical protein
MAAGAPSAPVSQYRSLTLSLLTEPEPNRAIKPWDQIHSVVIEGAEMKPFDDIAVEFFEFPEPD